MITTSFLTATVAWFENIDGRGGFGSQKIVTGITGGPKSVAVEDFDGDSDLDLAIGSTNGISWYENRDGLGDFSFRSTIGRSGVEVASIDAVDLDGDRRADLIVTYSSTNGDSTEYIAAWYQQMEDKGSFGSERVISPNALSSMAVGDVDVDGDLDVVTVTREWTVGWHENLNGAGTFSTQRVIASRRTFVRSLALGDTDLDGDLDLLAGFGESGNGVVLFKNGDHRGTFLAEQRVTSLANDVADVSFGDLDGDMDLDVQYASSFENQIVWQENRLDSNDFGEQRNVTPSIGEALPADVDADGDSDIVYTLTQLASVMWQENTDGRGSFSEATILIDSSDRLQNVTMLDLDGDDHEDLVAISIDSGNLFWQRNLGNKGQYGIRQFIDSERGILSTRGSDIDGDGDKDLLVTSQSAPVIRWYENPGDKSLFWSKHDTLTADSPGSGRHATALHDLDGDGDIDIIVASADGSPLTWYANDGSGHFLSRTVVHSAILTAFAVEVTDVDGNKSPDIVVASNSGVQWVPNDGSGHFGPLHTLIGPSFPFFQGAIEAADLDGDADLDVLLMSAGYLGWYENTDGTGTFAAYQLLRSEGDSFGGETYAIDVDHDQDRDLLYYSLEKLIWLEQRPLGDANRDGIFDSSDLILAFQAGEYEDRMTINSRFEEGDWNGDGDFDSSDLVFAFQSGDYESVDPRRTKAWSAAIDASFSSAAIPLD